MMQYDFTDESTVINGMEMETNIHSYQQQNSFTSDIFNSNMMTTNDIWQSSALNSNKNYQSLSSSFNVNNSNQYRITDNNHFDYQPSSYLVDPYSHIFPNNYSMDPYSNQTAIDSSTYHSPIDSYQQFRPIYTDPSPASPSIDIQLDYQSIPSQWDLGTIKMPSHNVTSISNSSKQPCLVCHEESSGYHFGAYTCESCKAFYRRVTKDPNIEIKHSCEIPLLNITKSNRKDCRACRKAKCDQVGMTILHKDRSSRTKSPFLSINNLLEQLAHDLTSNQLSTSSALENLLHLLDVPSIIPIDFDYHSFYMNAIHIWRNQLNYSSQIFSNISFNDTFAVLLFLFYSLMIMKENQTINKIQFDKLVNILQQEIHRITGKDHRSACRLKALFMKCYVTLAQFYPNSTNFIENNYHLQSQTVLPYQPYSIFN